MPFGRVELKEEIGGHSLWTLPVLGAVHADTILTTWLAMAVALVFLAYVGSSYRSPRAGRTQTVFEGVVDYIADLVYGSLGKGGEPFVPFFIALFIFIFLLNQFGILPFKALGLPFGGSPTADLNTTLALGLMMFVTIQVAAIRKGGIGAYKHIFSAPPGAPPALALLMTPINIIDEVARPVTLTLRLFFNIFVGELLLFVIASIINAKITIGAFNLSLAVTVLPLGIEFFNFFVGTVQAFIFTLLGVVYLSLATSADEH
jgi:F-type H+-transporting ATPase subunit a